MAKGIKKDIAIYGAMLVLIGAIIGGGATYMLTGRNNELTNEEVTRIAEASVRMNQGVPMDMDGMNKLSVSILSGLKDDEFDRMFLAMMLDHHEGAVSMSEVALTNAKHDEVKKLARDIIAAQNGEIDMIKTWQQDWGYDSDSGMHMMGQ